ncbi:MAG: type II toxin-antitoxin system RelE/ParE family toxin, partial [Vulcanimicrobiaceae bacterium]
QEAEDDAHFGRRAGGGVQCYARSDIFMIGSIDELIWMGSTKRDLAAAPEEIRKTMGGALRAAQQGGKSDDAKPMKGDLRNVMEIREHDANSIYRLMYTTKIGKRLYVLDYFQKKGTAGGATPKVDLDRIRRRYAKAKEHYAKETARRG